MARPNIRKESKLQRREISIMYMSSYFALHDMARGALRLQIRRASWSVQVEIELVKVGVTRKGRKVEEKCCNL